MVTQQHRIGGYRVGVRPDNTKFHNIGRFKKDQIPPKVDLRRHMTEVEEQRGKTPGV